jgi:hypothetical protein
MVGGIVAEEGIIEAIAIALTIIITVVCLPLGYSEKILPSMRLPVLWNIYVG